MAEYTSTGYEFLFFAVAVLATIALIFLIKMRNRIRKVDVSSILKYNNSIHLCNLSIIITLVIVVLACLQTFFYFLFPQQKLTSLLLEIHVLTSLFPFLTLCVLGMLRLVPPLKKLSLDEEHVFIQIHYGLASILIFTTMIIGFIQKNIIHTQFFVRLYLIMWIFGVILILYVFRLTINKYLEYRKTD